MWCFGCLGVHMSVVLAAYVSWWRYSCFVEEVGGSISAQASFVSVSLSITCSCTTLNGTSAVNVHDAVLFADDLAAGNKHSCINLQSHEVIWNRPGYRS